MSSKNDFYFKAVVIWSHLFFDNSSIAGAGGILRALLAQENKPSSGILYQEDALLSIEKNLQLA